MFKKTALVAGIGLAISATAQADRYPVIQPGFLDHHQSNQSRLILIFQTGHFVLSTCRFPSRQAITS